MEIRPYQQAAIDAVLASYDAGIQRTVVVAATGTGKTIMLGKLYPAMQSRLPGQMMVVGHTEAIVHQNAAKIQEVNPDIKVGIEMAGAHADPVCSDVISASVQTLGRKDTKRLEKFNWDSIQTIVIDECHHAVTDGYRRILDATGSLRPDTHKLLLGTTATPQRPDGESLSDLFEKVAYVYPIRTAIKEGWLVPIRGYRTVTDTSLDAVGKTDGDFIKSELSSTVNTTERNRQVVGAWVKQGENRKTLVFTVDIQHAKDLAQAFKDQEISAEAVWGDDPDREHKINDHRANKIRVLCNCSLTVEGYDDPSISCIIDAAPTMSGVRYTQKIGRGTRLSEGKIDLIVIDVVDGTTKHSLLTLPTLLGMQARLDLQGRSVLDVVEALEALKEEHPSVDFTKLESIDKAQWLIEQVDLFQVRFPAEVEQNSELMWFRAVDGGYKMLIPKENARAGFVRVFENAIGKWELIGRINEKEFHGTRPSIEEIFKVSDEQVRKRVTKMTLSMVMREATWHDKAVTRGQKKMLERLFPHKTFLYDQMTSGQASKMISERLARKA
jgi:superfamily II DNA or RNA helicase